MKFSVIVPVYNVAPYLRECLDSVLEQTFTDWETICVDDGSTDESGAILEEYAAKDKRFKVVRKTNAGVSSARNAGLLASTGEWVLFVDGDDLWHSGTLAVCAQLIEENPDAQIIKFMRQRFVDGCSVEWKDYPEKEKIDIRDLEAGLIDDDMRYSFVCNCCHRSVIPAHGFKNYVCGEDLLFRAECLLAAKRMVTTTRCLYAYRTRPGSATQSPINKRKLLDRIGFSIDWLDVLKMKPLHAGVPRYIAKNLTELYIQDLLSIDNTQRDELWDAWYDMLPKLLSFKIVTGWYRLVALVCLKTKLRVVAVLLCDVPAEIKRFKRSVFPNKG